jgi:deazaflavin-dependent oxidoreductase (nitroreductase family)
MYKKDVSEERGRDEPQVRKPPVIPTDMKAFNEKVMKEFRANHGQMSGPMAGRSILLLTTTGARTGKERTTVLGFGRAGDRLVVIASDNGAPAAPDWYHNLLASPIATVELGPEKFQVRAVTAQPDEREELARAVPYLKQQQTLTEREIPIVVLERS